MLSIDGLQRRVGYENFNNEEIPPTSCIKEWAVVPSKKKHPFNMVCRVFALERLFNHGRIEVGDVRGFKFPHVERSCGLFIGRHFSLFPLYRPLYFLFSNISIRFYFSDKINFVSLKKSREKKNGLEFRVSEQSP